MKFNPAEYEPVEDRIKRFYADHTDGRIITYLRSDPNNIDFAVFEAHVFVGEELKATGWAQERRDPELSKSKSGNEYESVNYTAWLENAETSAIGRALANFNYQGSKKRPSREEMQKTGRSGNNQPSNNQSNNNLRCPECGEMAVIKSKFAPFGYYCFDKLGGCKHKFAPDDPRITDQLNNSGAEEPELPQPDAVTEKENGTIPF